MEIFTKELVKKISLFILNMKTFRPLSLFGNLIVTLLQILSLLLFPVRSVIDDGARREWNVLPAP